MNCDDSDLSPLSDEDDFQMDNGIFFEMDADDGENVTFDLCAPTQWGIHTGKFNPVSFDFQEVGFFEYQSTAPIEYFMEYLDECFVFKIWKNSVTYAS
ncbi:hypothetical protein TNCT_88211 [Trichonephila clavata]|uniref:Uncharacterized protein n=1 Tax=Trichonephila clavata TaxID=2740835 RepID=A0A8X6HTR9_TRICU|nr:hypothetical protein TNCT_88211 [Trichonephila clavata]